MSAQAIAAVVGSQVDARGLEDYRRMRGSPASSAMDAQAENDIDDMSDDL